MFLGKDVIGNPIINVRNGLQIGQVQDLYIDHSLSTITGVYVGSKGLLSSTPKWIPASNVNLISTDTVLVNGDNIITEELDDVAQPWIRRDELQGHSVDTKGGTKIGRIGDIIIDNKDVVGFALDRVFVQGTIAQHRALRRTAILDTGLEDGTMTVDLDEAEQHDLQVVNKLFFGSEVVRHAEAESEMTHKSPYTDTHDDSTYADHSDVSPYIADEAKRVEDPMHRRSPYAAPHDPKEETKAEEFQKPVHDSRVRVVESVLMERGLAQRDVSQPSFFLGIKIGRYAIYRTIRGLVNKPRIALKSANPMNKQVDTPKSEPSIASLHHFPVWHWADKEQNESLVGSRRKAKITINPDEFLNLSILVSQNS